MLKVEVVRAGRWDETDGMKEGGGGGAGQRGAVKRTVRRGRGGEQSERIRKVTKLFITLLLTLGV